MNEGQHENFHCTNGPQPQHQNCHPEPQKPRDIQRKSFPAEEWGESQSVYNCHLENVECTN